MELFVTAWSFYSPTIKDTLGGKSVQLSHRENGSMDMSLGQELRVSVFPLLTPSIGV